MAADARGSKSSRCGGADPRGRRLHLLFTVPALVPDVTESTEGRGGRRACDGDRRAQPQSLPGAEGGQSGPALPQRPLRLPLQAVRAAAGPQRQRTGLSLGFIQIHRNIVNSVDLSFFSLKDVADSGRKYQLELSVHELISNVRHPD